MEFVTNSGGSQTNATTTLALATSLVFPVEANASYIIMAFIAYDAPTATDAKFNWSCPAGATMGRNAISQALGTTTNIDTNVQILRRSLATDIQSGGPNAVASAFSLHQEFIDLDVGSTAGNVQLQFAAVAAGTATLQADSTIYYQRIA
jgi:hypothetical protein